MSTTLSYGYLQPQSGDPGSTWFPALNADIQQLNDHNHNGTNSSLISNSVLAGGSVSVAAGSWTANGTGSYKQTVTVPAGYNMTDFSMTTRLTSSNHIIYPTIEYASASTFVIYTLDNTLDYTVLFR